MIKQDPSLLEEQSITRSAGKAWSLLTIITSPTRSSDQLVSVIQILLSKSYLIVLWAFVIRSDLYFFRSSIPSLRIESVTTTTNGEIAEIGFKGDMLGMDCKMATKRKYILE